MTVITMMISFLLTLVITTVLMLVVSAWVVVMLKVVNWAVDTVIEFFANRGK